MEKSWTFYGRGRGPQWASPLTQAATGPGWHHREPVAPRLNTRLNLLLRFILAEAKSPCDLRQAQMPEAARVVWLAVGHTHSESPAGVSGLSRLPSPVLSRLYSRAGLGHQSWRQSTADHCDCNLLQPTSCNFDLTSCNLDLCHFNDCGILDLYQLHIGFYQL